MASSAETEQSHQQGNGVQVLYPEPGTAPLEGLYLSHDLRRHLADGQSYVYSNFVASLDGRIALMNKETGQPEVPQETANDRDWRLLLELAAPADAIIVSGRYIRQLDEGKAQAEPPFEDETPEDIIAYRRGLGLAAQPALVVVSNSLDLPDSLASRLRKRPVIVVTSEQADDAAAQSLTDAGVPVIRAGQDRVDGAQLIDALQQRDLRLIYAVAGPAVLHTLLEARVLRRLYLTTVLRALSGTDYATLARGDRLDSAYDFDLAALYLDHHGPDGVQQLLQVYDHRE